MSAQTRAVEGWTLQPLTDFVRERGMPLGRLAILAQRATAMARRWLEQQ